MNFVETKIKVQINSNTQFGFPSRKTRTERIGRKKATLKTWLV
jgi:hypothetical protein